MKFAAPSTARAVGCPAARTAARRSRKFDSPSIARGRGGRGQQHNRRGPPRRAVSPSPARGAGQGVNRVFYAFKSVQSPPPVRGEGVGG